MGRDRLLSSLDTATRYAQRTLVVAPRVWTRSPRVRWADGSISTTTGFLSWRLSTTKTSRSVATSSPSLLSAVRPASSETTASSRAASESLRATTLPNHDAADPRVPTTVPEPDVSSSSSASLEKDDRRMAMKRLRTTKFPMTTTNRKYLRGERGRGELVRQFIG